MASIALRNRLHDATGRLDALLRIAEDGIIDNTERPEFDDIVEELRETMAAIYQVIYSGDDAKKERPDTGMSKRSRKVECGSSQSTSGYVDYSTDPHRVARPSFPRRGGVSL